MNKEERLRVLAKDWRSRADLNVRAAKGVIAMATTKAALREAAKMLTECATQLEAALADPTPTRDPETCWHIHLIKQVGPLDDGPAKSTRYRCQECGAFLVMKPYAVEVRIGAVEGGGDAANNKSTA